MNTQPSGWMTRQQAQVKEQLNSGLQAQAKPGSFAPSLQVMPHPAREPGAIHPRTEVPKASDGGDCVKRNQMLRDWLIIKHNKQFHHLPNRNQLRKLMKGALVGSGGV